MFLLLGISGVGVETYHGLYTSPPMRQRKVGVFNAHLVRELVRLSAVGREFAISRDLGSISRDPLMDMM